MVRTKRHLRRTQISSMAAYLYFCKPQYQRANEFSIIAIHGLGAHSEYTWTAKDLAHDRRVNWLKEFLCEDFRQARILNFSHNADWFLFAPTVTAYESARTLLQELKNKMQQQNAGHISNCFRTSLICQRGIIQCSSLRIVLEASYLRR